MGAENKLVSVVIPAFNAEATIDETLRSVRSQTHGKLEIVVVDDGSTDATAALAARHASVDPRITLIRQKNAGLSASRNRGIEATKGPFIAPIDADDLWAPNKIERQLRAITSGERIGLVYSWVAIIDVESRVVFLDSRSDAEGDVIEALCLRNFVGNGSSPLMDRQAVSMAGGYDETLRGCEDYKLYFRIAERYRFALIRDYLIGYRDLPNSLSSNFDLMLDAHARCEIEFGAAYPQWTSKLRRNRTRLIRFMASRSHRAGNRSQTKRLLWRMVREDPLGAISNLAEIGAKRLRRNLGRTGDDQALLGTRFKIGRPERKADLAN